ncbi:MAG: phospholipase D-like domain-containing protein [Gammaproteobacteria bacterium]|nr:phospholipase D-like domain-containing protein [Gammaproteobacteria bacterium]
MTFAVPYIGTLPGLPSVVEFFRRAVSQGTAISLVTKPPGTDRGTLDHHSARLIEQLGVSLMVRPRLHSKVYQFTFPQGDRNAFVGSANLSAGGFQRNDETVAHFWAKDENDEVEAELSRLSGPGATPYSQWLSSPTQGA